jgi:hypothetical protein
MIQKVLQKKLKRVTDSYIEIQQIHTHVHQKSIQADSAEENPRSNYKN